MGSEALVPVFPISMCIVTFIGLILLNIDNFLRQPFWTLVTLPFVWLMTMKLVCLLIKKMGWTMPGGFIFLSSGDEVISWSLKTDTISDTDPLFNPLQLEDCEICFLSLPFLVSGKQYKSCCGKVLCSGCMYAVKKNGGKLCPFCRTSSTLSREKKVDLLKKRVDVNDAAAIYVQGCHHDSGEYGFQQDCAKALSLWHRAGKLGCSGAYTNIGNAYFKGELGVERNMRKAKQYYELAAMECPSARHNLGLCEELVGNVNRAVKYFTIAAGCGHGDSLKRIRNIYLFGYATKVDYEKALRAYQKYLIEIRSDQRDQAAAFSDDYRYY